MALQSTDQWEALFNKLNIPATEASTYAKSFHSNRMNAELLAQTTPDDLRTLGINA